MTFNELFREKYRTALNAARIGDSGGTKQGLLEICNLFAGQYSLENGDKIVTKSSLKHWQEVFGTYIGIIDKFGLSDIRVQKLFGLITDASAPSFSDLLRGGVSVPPSAGLDIAGLAPSEEERRSIMPIANDKKPVPPEIVIDTPKATEEKPFKYGDGATNNGVTELNTLDDFIGQQHIVSRIKAEIQKAIKKGIKHLDNILLLGNRGLGKTTLMKLIAKELGVRFEFIDCSGFLNSVQSQKAILLFFQNIARLDEPVFIGLDEIHAAPTAIQTGLLTLLESREFAYMDNQGRNHRIPIDNFTFCGCTTDDDKVLGTIKDRCRNLTFQLVDYTPDELRQIFINSFAALNLTVTDKALTACIGRCRSSLRELKAFVNGIETIAINSDLNVVTVEMVEQYFKEAGIDAIGLTIKDIEILKAIQSEASGAIGVDALAAKVSIDAKKLVSEYEPFLIKIGFISIVSGKGRSLTETATQYLKETDEI